MTSYSPAEVTPFVVGDEGQIPPTPMKSFKDRVKKRAQSAYVSAVMSGNLKEAARWEPYLPPVGDTGVRGVPRGARRGFSMSGELEGLIPLGSTPRAKVEEP